MSLQLYRSGGLRFWTEKEIESRRHIQEALVREVKDSLMHLNPAWTFYQVEGPLLTPKSYISSEYTENDAFFVKATVDDQTLVLRPETTSSSYEYAKYLMTGGKQYKAPICVWQSGKSFRRELSDGATASKLRFNEFYQLEFQCVYSEGTHVLYREGILNNLIDIVSKSTDQRDLVRFIDSDRLPSYAESTVDIEVYRNDRWIEVASVSIRNDFMIGYKVLEIAFGLDRLVCLRNEIP